MANVTLMTYLQRALPQLPVIAPPAGRNTENAAYYRTDIRSIAFWPAFNLNTILTRYRPLLTTTRLAPDRMPLSPRKPVNAENTVKHRACELVHPRVRRGLREGFGTLVRTNMMGGQTAVSFDVGEAAQLIERFIPDLAFFVENQFGTSRNRVPGDVKPSWKWSTAMRTGTTWQRHQYRQVLSQVNWYMRQHGSRYGFVLTDIELVAIQRLDDNGNLLVSNSISWQAGGTARQPQLTVLLALWYLGMLAAQDLGPGRWSM
jgi:hypothetical protein